MEKIERRTFAVQGRPRDHDNTEDDQGRNGRVIQHPKYKKYLKQFHRAHDPEKSAVRFDAHRRDPAHQQVEEMGCSRDPEHSRRAAEEIKEAGNDTAGINS
jgi:hypothetical protein